MKTKGLKNQHGVRIELETDRLPSWVQLLLPFDAEFRNNIFSIQNPFKSSFCLEIGSHRPTPNE